ncbi:MAG: A/G-specific adenine glycosylase [Fimbriimonadaceae bacterium]|nr:A/G-specific adenine glycosylase [Fimbriimonadaceae bacterium]
MNQFADALIAWYEANGRDLPWRRTRDPYAIWVSEIMLQQTQVATALPYYERWLARFPTVESLAAAPEADVLALWQGLGYYRRARMLHDGARTVVANGRFPASCAEWRAIPGVGAYTAGAISSISLGLPEPVVDGNVERVFARVTSSSATGPALNRAAWSWVHQVFDPARADRWNQAVMELGATVCTPRQPACDRCPIAAHCVALAEHRPADFPVRVARAKPTPIEMNSYVVRCAETVLLRQRGADEWWHGLWDFPDAVPDTLAADAAPIGTVRHVVTTHRVTRTVFVATLAANHCSEMPAAELPGVWFRESDLPNLAMPTPARRAWAIATRAPTTLF